jgi:OmcA/MtrC family decaheme c-type cytochrome
MSLNGSPDLGETTGEWVGKSTVDGTFSAGVWGYRSVMFDLFGETNTYRGSAPSVRKDFLTGDADTLAPYDLISSAQNCNTCHEDLWFHGGTRRGYDSCLLCHGTAGSEDRPRYIAANAPDTTGVTVNFRTMLHKIHMGEELTNASTYTLVGFGLGYPNNFSTHTYEHVVFPDLPDGVKNCEHCHGPGNTAWMSPADRNHPTEQGSPVRAWSVVCGSCHDSDAAAAHILQSTTGGIESCAVCHGIDDALNVELVHKVRR